MEPSPHWRPKRFRESGKLIQVEQIKEITPPDKLEALASKQDPFPELSTLLAIPLDEIIHLVKNKTEVNVLYQIRQQSSQLSVLIRLLTEELQAAEIIENASKKIIAEDANDLVYLTPLIDREVQTHFKNVKSLLEKIAKCLTELAFQKRALMQYQEINASLSEELSFEGCAQLSKDKAKLAALEAILLKRLDSLFYKGPPYRSFSTSWDDFNSSQEKSPKFPEASDSTPPTPTPETSHKPKPIPEHQGNDHPNPGNDSEDDLTNRTKELMKSTQEKLFSFDSSWPISSGSSSESASTPSTPLRGYLKKRPFTGEDDEEDDPEWKKIKMLSTSPRGSHSDGSFFFIRPKTN